MKKPHAFAHLVAGVVIGFVAALCAAQTPKQASGEQPSADASIGLGQLESFVMYLQDTGQTNILQRFGEYLNASIVSKNSADLGTTVAILQRLRDGHTNNACELLELKMDGDIVGFAGSYRELPASLRQQVSLKILGYAK